MREPTTMHSVWDVVGEYRVHGRVSDLAHARQQRDVRERSGPRDIVFVHGLGMATDYLEPTMRLLVGDYAVSALDLPGFGRSRIPRGRVLSLGELAAALGGWMRARGIESPVLVGQSHGCQVVVEQTVKARDAGGLVLNAPTMLDDHRTTLEQIGLVALDTPREPLALVPHVVRDYLRAGPRRILATLADAARDRIEDKLPLVDCPISIVCGARDPVSPPAWGQRLARLTGSANGHSGGAAFRVVDGAAHALPFSHADALAAEIIAVAARVDRMASG